MNAFITGSCAYWYWVLAPFWILFLLMIASVVATFTVLRND